MSVIQQLVHRTHAATSTLRAAHFVAVAVISLALVAGFGVGQSLAYQQWINMLLMRDTAMPPAAASPLAKDEAGSALPAELRHGLESFLDLAEEALSSKDKPADVTGDDDTAPQLRPSRLRLRPERRGQTVRMPRHAN